MPTGCKQTPYASVRVFNPGGVYLFEALSGEIQHRTFYLEGQLVVNSPLGVAGSPNPGAVFVCFVFVNFKVELGVIR